MICAEDIPVTMSANSCYLYTRLDKIPSFLHKYADTILRTGKYLNVIQQCDKSAQWAAIQPLEYLTNSEHYLPIIEKVRKMTSKGVSAQWAAIQPLEYLTNSEHYLPIIDKVRNTDSLVSNSASAQ
jgi:Gamma tubulin complex component N-terminal